MDNPNSDHGEASCPGSVRFRTDEGRATSPKSVTVVLSEDTLVITLHGALSPAETGAGQESGRRRPGAGVSPPAVRQLRRLAAAGDQKNHRRGRARSGCRSRAGDWHRREGVHDRHRGPSVPARRQRNCRHLERERARWSGLRQGGFPMLVLSRKIQESVVVGGSDGFQRILKVKVLEIQRREGETGLRRRSRCPGPSPGGVGTHLRQRPVG